MLFLLHLLTLKKVQLIYSSSEHTNSHIYNPSVRGQSSLCRCEKCTEHPIIQKGQLVMGTQSKPVGKQNSLSLGLNVSVSIAFNICPVDNTMILASHLTSLIVLF